MTKEDYEFVSEHPLYPSDKGDPMTPYFEAFTFEYHGQVMGCGGFQMITETTAWAWLCMTENVGHNLIPTVRVIKEYLDKWCKSHDIIRLQAWVKIGFAQGARMVEHLGFVEEGPPMRHFCGQGAPAQLYVKMFQENG